MMYLQLVCDDVHGFVGLGVLCGDKDAHEAAVVVEGAEGGAVVDPVVLVQHALVQPAVHSFSCHPHIRDNSTSIEGKQHCCSTLATTGNPEQYMTPFHRALFGTVSRSQLTFDLLCVAQADWIVLC